MSRSRAADSLNVLDWARRYTGAGYIPIQVKPRSKIPAHEAWQKTALHSDAELVSNFGAGDVNIGLLLGACSGGLVDVDLDAPEAVVCADEFLPPSVMVHGHRSKPRSHRFYIASVKTRTFKDHDNAMLVELRGSGQTVVPPSIHESGELIAWYQDFKPAEGVDEGSLSRAVAHVAACALMARVWPKAKGSRHHLALAFSGFLIRHGCTTELCEKLIVTAARVAGDEEWQARRADVRTTAANLQKGNAVTGAPTVKEILAQGGQVCDRLEEWLELQRSADDRKPSSGHLVIEEEPGEAQPLLMPNVPDDAMVGLGKDFAHLYAESYEAPIGYWYMAFLTVCGHLLDRRVSSWEAEPVPTRLYTLLLGSAGVTKKSTAIKETIAFFKRLPAEQWHPCVLNGAGSGEGVAERLGDLKVTPDRRVLMQVDEIDTLLAKARQDGSCLYPLLTTLFESEHYENMTRGKPICVEGGSLGLLTSTTPERYEVAFDTKGGDIGLLTRLLIVTGQPGPAKPIIMPLDRTRYTTLQAGVIGALSTAKREPYQFTPAGMDLFSQWALEVRRHLPLSTRLDSIAKRLLLILAVMSQKLTFDPELVRAVTALMNYQLEVRRLIAPILADNKVAEMEQKILRVLLKNPPHRMPRRKLSQTCNASRAGEGTLGMALNNLKAAEHVTLYDDRSPSGHTVKWVRLTEDYLRSQQGRSEGVVRHEHTSMSSEKNAEKQTMSVSPPAITPEKEETLDTTLTKPLSEEGQGQTNQLERCSPAPDYGLPTPQRGPVPGTRLAHPYRVNPPVWSADGKLLDATD